LPEIKITEKKTELNISSATDETADWNTYNEGYVFEIKYPKDAQISPYETHWFNRPVTAIEIPTVNENILGKKIDILAFKLSSYC
jgi:hypothetical protein